RLADGHPDRAAPGHAGARGVSEGRLDRDAEGLLRELTPRVLAALVRNGGDFATAEDAVQEALLAAFERWPAAGVPRNPGGWLYHVATRRLADLRAAERARRRREAAAAASAMPAAAEPGAEGFDEGPADDTLALLFTCCHPALTPPSAIALTL